MQIERLDLPPEGLSAIPTAERSMLVLLGHAMNEINVFAKLFLVAGQFEDEPRWYAHGQACQALILGRALTGKLHEMWQFIAKGYLKTSLSNKYGPLLDPDAKEALASLKKYFGKKNLVTEIRNRFAFHYSLDEASRVVPPGTPSRDLCIYFGPDNATSLYQFSEAIMGVSMFRSIDQSDLPTAFGKLITETSNLTSWFNAFSQSLMYLILEDSFGKDDLSQMLRPMKISSPHPTRSAIKLPFFTNPIVAHRPKSAA